MYKLQYKSHYNAMQSAKEDKQVLLPIQAGSAV